MKKFLSPFTVLLFVFFLVGAGCSGTTDVNQKDKSVQAPETQEGAQGINLKDGFLSYENATYGVTLQYPKEWEKEDTGSDPIVVFYSQQDGNTDLFRENFNIIAANLEGYVIDLDEYLDINITELKAGIPEFKSAELKKVSVANVEAYRTTYTGNLENTDLTWTQWYLIKDGFAYVLTYSGFGDGYDKYLSTAEDMVKTINIE